jgi:hypothetical protein
MKVMIGTVGIGAVVGLVLFASDYLDVFFKWW